MSELTSCNFCNLRDLKRRAKSSGERIVISNIREPVAGMAGVVVLRLPKGVTLAQVNKLSDEEREQYQAAWFGALTDHCVC